MKTKTKKPSKPLRNDVARLLARPESWFKPSKTMKTKTKKPKKLKRNVSRQCLWQRKQKAAGNCVQCGFPSAYGVMCYTCAAKQREYSRAYSGSKEWRPGSRGRIPLFMRPVNLLSK